MNESTEFQGPSLKTTIQIGLLIFVFVTALKMFAAGTFSRIAFANSPDIMHDTMGRPMGVLPSITDILGFMMLLTVMSVFGLWPLVGKFVDWVKSIVKSTAKVSIGRGLNPDKVRNVMERMNGEISNHASRIEDLEALASDLQVFRAAVEAVVPEVIPPPEPVPPTAEELQRQISELKIKLEAAAVPQRTGVVSE